MGALHERPAPEDMRQSRLGLTYRGENQEAVRIRYHEEIHSSSELRQPNSQPVTSHVADPVFAPLAPTHRSTPGDFVWDKVLNDLQALKSKIMLIHDVWTTKGNQQAFLGIIATYISDDWVFKVCHLALKYIAWTHKGKYLAVPMASILMKSSIASKITQTTDSGSNNHTMTVEVDRLIGEKLGVDLNLASNHVRCFCHKIALILTAGLKAIDISTEGLAAEKQETLGSIPKLNTIIEEPEEQDVQAIDSDSEEEDILEDGPDDSEGKSDPEEPGGSHGTQGSQNRTQERSRVSMVLKKVDFVIQQITSSAARQSEFAVWAKKLEHVGVRLKRCW
ncbi:hypothetical protein PSTG_12815 [Puccinia striiformis f. sp. tritici PST-78]|uniref:hAT-like transposase RNase-H fold domain-containing protein n=1 Tax=Puccinia striiformis f. sp. tritici PST-78 TaxID=1165861 RepID=A0A0L0V3Q1_9BASI|nr:hypothetical protein PSTG_12815 [Puccinia striiformis f. sp. tritici PST-78]